MLVDITVFIAQVEKMRRAHNRIDELLVQASRKDNRDALKALAEVSLMAGMLEKDVDRTIQQFKSQNQVL